MTRTTLGVTLLAVLYFYGTISAMQRLLKVRRITPPTATGMPDLSYLSVSPEVLAKLEVCAAHVKHCIEQGTALPRLLLLGAGQDKGEFMSLLNSSLNDGIINLCALNLNRFTSQGDLIRQLRKLFNDLKKERYEGRFLFCIQETEREKLLARDDLTLYDVFPYIFNEVENEVWKRVLFVVVSPHSDMIKKEVKASFDEVFVFDVPSKEVQFELFNHHFEEFSNLFPKIGAALNKGALAPEKREKIIARHPLWTEADIIAFLAGIFETT